MPLPKVIQSLIDSGKDMQSLKAEDIASLEPKVKKDLHNSLSYSLKTMDEANATKFKELRQTQGVDEMLKQYAIDVALAGTRIGTNKSTVKSAVTTKEKEVWLTKAQLASPSWLSNAEHADILAEDGRPRRPYQKSAALAAAGVEEFCFTSEEIERVKSNEFEASVSASAALDAEDYAAVKTMMDNELKSDESPRPKKRAKQETQKKKPHAIFARVNIARQGFTKSLKAIKDSVDKATTELKQVEKVKDNLVKKGWPSTLGDCLDEGKNEVQSIIDKEKDFWASESVKEQVALPHGLTGKEPDLSEEQVSDVEQIIVSMNSSTKLFSESKKKIDHSLRRFVTGKLADTIKIC